MAAGCGHQICQVMLGPSNPLVPVKVATRHIFFHCLLPVASRYPESFTSCAKSFPFRRCSLCVVSLAQDGQHRWARPQASAQAKHSCGPLGCSLSEAPKGSPRLYWLHGKSGLQRPSSATANPRATARLPKFSASRILSSASRRY